jgi:hypothetical protein
MTTVGHGRAIRPVPSPINPPRPWHRRRFTVVAAVALAVILTATAIIWRPWQTEPLTRVSDGSTTFVDYLDEVSHLIQDENHRVAGSGRAFVSIAFMLPLRTGKENPKTTTSIRHELEGAYLAQYWSNHENADDDRFTSSAPLIKLLLADSGAAGSSWPDTVEQLVDRLDSDHLVAVAGLGSSVTTTQSAVTALAAHGIPMFGAVVTSARLKGPNLARVSPTNADEAMAATHYLRTTPQWLAGTPAAPYKAYLVQDTAVEDSYAADLASAYRASFPRDDPAHVLLDANGGYDSSRPAAGNVLASLVNTVCAIQPDLVFFAGRSNELRDFLGKLATRPNSCADGGQPITVMTGDQINNLTNTPRLWTGENINLLYTALATPQAWNPAAGGSGTISPAAIARFTTGPHSYVSLFGDDLEDGHAIMSYDAMLTATEATRRAHSDETPVPVPAALVNGLHQINAQNAIPGASGWIYFQNTKEPPEWLPFNKAIPIMNLNRDGKATFLRLSSRLGVPPGPPSAG